MITKNSVVQFQNLIVNHDPRPIKSNSEWQSAIILSKKDNCTDNASDRNIFRITSLYVRGQNKYKVYPAVIYIIEEYEENP